MRFYEIIIPRVAYVVAFVLNMGFTIYGLVPKIIAGIT
jgi:hypothetical protein